MVKMTVFGAFLKHFLKKCKNIEIREISANMCYTVKIYISAHKTHPVRLRSDSGAVLSFLGLTGHDPGGFCRHPCSACTASGHDQLNVPTPIEAKYEKLWKPRKMLKNPTFSLLVHKRCHPPYLICKIRASLERSSGKLFFLKKIRSIRGVSSSE